MAQTVPGGQPLRALRIRMIKPVILILVGAVAASCEGESDCPALPAGGGLTSCDSSRIERVEVAACSTTAHPPPTERCPASATGECTQHGDCVDRENGRCFPHYPQLASVDSGCECVYGCVEDADCDPGQVCFCMEDRGECVNAGCRSNDDCGEYACVASRDACGTHGLYCTTAQDKCEAGTDGGCVYWTDRGYWDAGGALGCP